MGFEELLSFFGAVVLNGITQRGTGQAFVLAVMF